MKGTIQEAAETIQRRKRDSHGKEKNFVAIGVTEYLEKVSH
jgi:hypothetical protein